VPLLGGTVSTASRHLSHTLTLVVNLVVLGAVLAFTVRQAPRRRRGGERRLSRVYGPSLLVGVGAVFILADNTRHVLQDSGIWPPGVSSPLLVVARP